MICSENLDAIKGLFGIELISRYLQCLNTITLLINVVLSPYISHLKGFTLQGGVRLVQ